MPETENSTVIVKVWNTQCEVFCLCKDYKAYKSNIFVASIQDLENHSNAFLLRRVVVELNVVAIVFPSHKQPSRVDISSSASTQMHLLHKKAKREQPSQLQSGKL